jgi:hypothetical protein
VDEGCVSRLTAPVVAAQVSTRPTPDELTRPSFSRRSGQGARASLSFEHRDLLQVANPPPDALETVFTHCRQKCSCRALGLNTSTSLSSTSHLLQVAGLPPVALEKCSLLIARDLPAGARHLDLILLRGMIRPGLDAPTFLSFTMRPSPSHLPFAGCTKELFFTNCPGCSCLD